MTLFTTLKLGSHYYGCTMRKPGFMYQHSYSVHLIWLHFYMKNDLTAAVYTRPVLDSRISHGRLRLPHIGKYQSGFLWTQSGLSNH